VELFDHSSEDWITRFWIAERCGIVNLLGMMVHVGSAIGAFHFRALWFHGLDSVCFLKPLMHANEREWKLKR
jgi:hypothetical protein